jgi:hypothetical protein
MYDFGLVVFCVFILKLISQSPVQCSVSLLSWRSGLGWKLCPSLSAFLTYQLPSAPCADGGGQEHTWYTDPFSASTGTVLNSLWDARFIYSCFDLLYTESLCVLYSTGIKRTIADGTCILGGICWPVLSHHPFMNSSSASFFWKFRELSLFLFQLL